MESAFSVLLEILKLTIPGMIVFLTVYYLVKQYLDGQIHLKTLELKQSQQGTSRPLRFQAYERLSLFCERIALSNLLLRTPKNELNAVQYKVILLMAIQSEYEHNITQQVYVSDQLWEIIKVARDDTVSMISLAAEQVDPKGPAVMLESAILNILGQREATGLDKALVAIKKEAALLLS
ncbi:MAG: hypothetical protein MK226_08150 [Saprospiraceae bacterium]|jgi:hypothetical protein|nr:hypothetical protein [Saprospiraceae bacterium]